MKFMRLTAGYILSDHRKNENIEELKVDPVEKTTDQSEDLHNIKETTGRIHDAQTGHLLA
jgi:hypothetical protein